MIRFSFQNNIVKEFPSYFTKIKEDFSPLSEIIYKGNYQSYSVSYDDANSQTSLSDTYIFLVNIKNSSSIYFILNKADFKKDEITSKVSSLKDIEVVDIKSAKEKTLKLLEIIKDYNPLFIIYIQRKGFNLYDNELRYALYDARMEYTHTFFFEKKEEDLIEAGEVETKELPAPPIVDNNDTIEITKPVKEKKEKHKKEHNSKFHFPFDISKIKDFLSRVGNNISKNKYHFIFLMVSSFLIGFSGSIGVYNSIIGKTIAVLFFICGLVGATLNTFIYIDYFRTNKFKDELFIYSVIANLIGELISIGGFAIFYISDNSPAKKNISMGLIVLYGLLIQIFLVAITIYIGYFISKYRKQKKEQNTKE